MKKLKVVITGGAGFIGSHIVEYWVNNGAEVCVIDNLRSGFLSNIEKFPDVKFYNGSVTDKELVLDVLKNTDYVHHLAALVSVPESIEKPYECIEINIIGLINVLEAAKFHKVKKVVFSSSAAVYGDNKELPKTIKTIPDPKSPYGITKLDGEYYLKMYNDEYGLGTVSLRYFNVFGPRQNPKSQYAAAIPIFINKALKNEPIIIYGDGTQTRDFIYVKDVVLANVLAATSNINGVFNVALGKSISINEIAKEIIKLTNSQSKIIYEKERKGDIKYSQASIKETVEQLNFIPQYTLQQGLEETIKYFKDNSIK
ncbi:SDR family oxidoreductase [Rosettibacter firmus]|uniref:SDR family oxidoreductase n=1 Tax=Rosettibacter firmus TaxID=3111522 RepID=UPI00336BD5EA